MAKTAVPTVAEAEAAHAEAVRQLDELRTRAATDQAVTARQLADAAADVDLTALRVEGARQAETAAEAAARAARLDELLAGLGGRDAVRRAKSLTGLHQAAVDALRALYAAADAAARSDAEAITQIRGAAAGGGHVDVTSSGEVTVRTEAETVEFALFLPRHVDELTAAAVVAAIPAGAVQSVGRRATDRVPTSIPGRLAAVTEGRTQAVRRTPAPAAD